MDTVDLGYGCGFPSTSKFKEVKLSAKGKLACRLMNAKFSESKQVPQDAEREHHGAHGRVTAVLLVWTHRQVYNLYYPIAKIMKHCAQMMIQTGATNLIDDISFKKILEVLAGKQGLGSTYHDLSSHKF